MSLHKGSQENSTARGTLRYRLYYPVGLGLFDVTIAAGATHVGNVVCVEGYEHFQIWIDTLTLPSTLEIRMGGYHPEPTINRGTFSNMVIGTLALTGGGQAGTLYFGSQAAPAPSSAGDTFRVGRFIRFSIRNTGAAQSTGINGYLEATG